MPGIDYEPDRPGAAPPDEVLDTGRQRRLPPWLVPLGVIAVLTAAAGITIARNNATAPPGASTPPSGRPLPTPTLSIAPVGLGDGRLGRPLVSGLVWDVAVAGDKTWVLRPTELRTYIRSKLSAQVELPPGFGSSPAESPRLVLDVPAGAVWVVEEGRRHGQVLRYQLDSLRPEPGVLRQSINGAAALGGHLYLTSGSRLLAIAPGGPARTVFTSSSALGPIVTDSARGRLLMTNYGRVTRVWPVTPTRTGTARVGKPAVVNAVKPSLGVAEGVIWLGGFSQQHAVLRELDPMTLGATRVAPAQRTFGPGAVIVASGVVVIWVRDGGSNELRCIDAATGRALQSWMVDGTVASAGSHAMVANEEGAERLQLSTCSG